LYDEKAMRAQLEVTIAALRVSTAVLLAVGMEGTAQTPSIAVRVLEGNGAINNISRRTAYAPVVQVIDGSNRPIPQVAVTFTVPAIGPGARFSDGGTTFSVTTDQDGKASARGLTPNNTPGPFEIRVTAVHQGRTARAIITQTNAAPVKVESGNTRRLLLIGLIAGAAAGGLLATQSGGSNSPQQPGSPPPVGDAPVGSITPGQPGFGPPQ
jgi:hypothetical protein